MDKYFNTNQDLLAILMLMLENVIRFYRFSL